MKSLEFRELWTVLIVPIIAPKDANHLYRNRKQKLSLNVTITIITNLNYTLNAFVWKMSDYRKEVEEDYLQNGLVRKEKLYQI